MSKEELDIQKEIEKYFTESTGFGRDKIANFMDIVNKALKQKGERIEELEKENKTLEGCLLAEQEYTQMLEKQIERMKCCVVSCCEGCERLPKLYKEFENGNKEM